MALTRIRLWLGAVLLAVIALLVAREILASPSARRAVYRIHPADDLFGTLKKLRAGDEVLIHSGTYKTPGRYELRLAGTATAPIVIRGVAGEARPVIVGAPSQNVIDISGSHFELSHIEIRGGSHGLRLGDVDHATLADLDVHDLVNVGISCNRAGTVCDAVVIRDSKIYDTGHDGTGEGIYVGCQSADCVFKHGEIEGNAIHDTGRQKGDGIQIKPGSYGNAVRDNTVYRTTFPAITIWGCGGPRGALNRIEGNRAWMNGRPGIWIGGRAIVQGNTVTLPGQRVSALSSCRPAGGVRAAGRRSLRCAPPSARC